MSLITRCPACTTIFKVVPDQLRVSGGWVRCGQCDEVFDANAHLQTALPLEVVEQTNPAPQAPQPIVQQAIEVAAEYDWGVVVGKDMESAPVEVVDAQVSEPIELEPVKDQELLARPAFMRDAAAPLPKNWGQRRIQWLWGVGACLFAALLSLQWTVQERDRLSANAPSLKPILESVCVAIGCKISPMQSIDSVVIDSSAFSKLQANVYQLSFSLKSTAIVEIAAPSLELTLTDMQDLPLMRRVFSPGELGRSNQNLNTGVEWAGAKTLVLTPSPAMARVAGYRLVAFYP